MVDDDKNHILADSPIKLFGKSIQLPKSKSVEPITSDTDAGGDDCDSGLEDELDDEGTLNDKKSDHEVESGKPQIANQRGATSGTGEIPEKSSAKSKATALSSSRAEEENNDAALPQEKTLKKPDKIIPCPRCDSIDTKFCYFNNYNVNQPRYFCRKCQRYWTSGGTMRKLPVGAGRRKSKSSSVHYPTIAPHCEFQSASVPHVNGPVHRPVAINGSILSFAPDQHIHQISPPEVVGVARQASTQNGSSNHLTEAGVVINDNATGSAGSFSNIENDNELKAREHSAQSYQSFQPQMLCYPAPLWPPYPWNPAQYSYPLPAPINIQPGFPMPFYPAPMFMGRAVHGAWNMPWSQPSLSPITQPDLKSPILGKHSREDNADKPISVTDDVQNEEESRKPCIWVPKTLRINDLEEAAKSSIWATLGIQTDNIVATGGKGHFKLFSSLTNETSSAITASSALLANPAALSRSMKFRESS